VFERRLLGGALLAGALMAGALVEAPAGAASTSSPNASALYQQAIATTRSWSVHYASASTQSKVTLLLSGDAGPASVSQTVATGTAPGADSTTIVVIGGTTFVKGNAGGLRNLAGLSATQASAAAGQWIAFSTDNAAFAQVVAGVRSLDVAHELVLKGPLTLGQARKLDGYAVEAIKGTQSFGRTSQHVVLYVRARGPHVPVEEDSVGANGRPSAAEHVTYSKWGETVRPEAPLATVTIGPVSAV
jgi:hypothetical protein